jgi:hypothetical protein
VNTAHQPADYAHGPRLLSRNRLTFDEQLCLFGPASEAHPCQGSVGSWAALALALVVLPWALVGWMIWLLV